MLRANGLYTKHSLRQIYYSAFSPIPDASAVLPLDIDSHPAWMVRLKVLAMLKEMPRKYWRKMPETALGPDMMAGAQAQLMAMV